MRVLSYLSDNVIFSVCQHFRTPEVLKVQSYLENDGKFIDLFWNHKFLRRNKKLSLTPHLTNNNYLCHIYIKFGIFY